MKEEDKAIPMQSSFWRQHAFTLVIIACAAFVVLTAVAMLFYPGGTVTDSTTKGYSFFTNFFSDLGMTQSHSKQPSPVSSVLFFVAMVSAGGALVLFFIAFPRLFVETSSGKILSIIGSIFGVVSGICFVGVAFTPANLYLDAHVQFVLWAFRLFPVAVVFYAIAIFRERDYPKRYAWVFVAFAILLVLYILLLEGGPSVRSPEGLMIQATGQKIIGYASIISVLIQAWGARGVARNSGSIPSGSI